jgi:protein-tyrosine phosphatase
LSDDAPGRLLTGAANFRAIPSLPASSGMRLRPGMIYRSGELSALTDRDMAIVESLGIRLICDLRSSAERQRFRARWPPLAPARVLEMPAESDRDAGLTALAARLAHEPSPAGARRTMLAIYQALPALLAPMLSSMFEAIGSGWGAPLLIHCHIGKDRTGIATALLLTALGIEREAITADYLATADYLDLEAEARAIAKVMGRIIGRTLEAETTSELIAADPAYLHAAFAAITRAHGSTDAYLAEATALTPSRRARLRSLLLA